MLRRYGRRLLALFACLVLLPFLYGEAEAHVVRVGYYHEPNFQEGKGPQDYKRGYAYEYYQRLAQLTDWKYEYVYGDYDELYQMLLRGEIDFLAGLAYTEARKDLLLYPQLQMGEEHYNLVRRLGDTSMVPESLGSKTIGALEGAQTEVIRRYLAEQGLQQEVIVYPNMKQRDAALRSGEVDTIIAEDSMGDFDGLEAYAQGGTTKFYIVVNKQQPELLQELNQAQRELLDREGDIYVSLRRKYMRHTAFNVSLTEQEQVWLNNHRVLRVGYLTSEMPFSGLDSKGQPDGLIKELLPLLFQDLQGAKGLTFELKGYKHSGELHKDLLAGKIDAGFPVDSDNWIAEQADIQTTEGFVAAPWRVIFREGKYTAEPETIAVGKSSLLHKALAEIYYPRAKKYYCSSKTELLEAVKDGRADVAILDAYKVSQLSGTAEYRGLSSQVADIRSYSFGVARENTALMSLLNRAISLQKEDFTHDLLLQHNDPAKNLTFMDYFYRHSLLAIGLVLAALALCGGVALDKSRGIKREKALNASLQEAQHEQEAQLQEITALNEALQEKQAHLEEVSCEQEAQLEEITALNGALQEKQAHLEEVSCEQEAQLEEINSLNGALQDQQRKLEEAKGAAEAANQAKTNFLFSMSHDIRTPMNAIIGYTELLEKYKEDQVRREDYIAKIKSANEFLLSLINNVLEMARIESGKVVLSDEAVCVLDFNKEIESVYGELMKEKKVDFSVTTHIQTEYVWGDRVKVREVFLNLISNAYKYTPAGGTVAVSIRELPAEQEGYTIMETTVADTGIGMSPEFLPHIFEDFSREHTSTENKIQGTGLGMPIVKRLVELMGGTIKVESTLGKGTTFVFTVLHRKATKADAQEARGTAVQEKGFAGKRLLLAEDNELNAEIALELLGEMGFGVDHAADGISCVEMLLAAEPGYYDLILMDVQMPRLDGYGATRRIRALEDKAKAGIPILAMTANAFEEDKQNAKEAGMNGHVAKPIDVQELLSELAKVLQG